MSKKLYLSGETVSTEQLEEIADAVASEQTKEQAIATWKEKAPAKFKNLLEATEWKATK